MDIYKTLWHRAENYNYRYAKWPASHLTVTDATGHGREWLSGVWLIGNNYRNKSLLYGAYPATYLERIMSMYEDADCILHLFSGSLPPGNYCRVDLIQPADIQCDAHRLSEHVNLRFDLCMADPPYTKADAAKYGTPMINRKRIMNEVAKVVIGGGHLVWLDTTLPMFSKSEWQICGFIGIVRSTNHRYRMAAIFERV